MKANDFTLQNQNGEDVSLSDYKGKKVILYFYPKDNTPGCTTEACDFRDRSEEFEKLNAVIIGISKDSIKNHTNFITKYGLPFQLLSDPENSVIEAYGAWVLKKNYGREYMGIERSTFLIDEEGNIAREWRKVRVKEHVEAVLESLKEV